MAKMFERLRDLVLGGKCEDSNGTAPALVIKVRCAHCGEEIATRVEKAHALQEQYEADSEGEEPEITGYLLQKELLGEKCQELVRLTMHFDPCRRLVKHEISGGELVEVVESE
ncbi:MAG: hypothetical protein GX100_07325 [candidate division WS1 bacterium]|jgi:hypothetical protein|nr:hypothetical protein [candidate division WS1 bacterium]